jgi:Bacterial SH3 domain
MDNLAENKGRSGGRRLVIALASCAFGAALILLASQMSSKSADQTGRTEEESSPKTQKKKTQRAWNIALGNVVVVAQDLGLNVKTLKGGQVEEAKIAARLESQLQGLRDFYRRESEREATLMGGMLLQLTVSPSGDVTHVKELVSRITDDEFKKSVLEEASKWTFPEIITDSTTITCPILFVREGMDITTIVQWEKTLGQFSATAKTNAQLTQQTQAPEGAKRNEPVAKTVTVSNKAKAEQNAAAKSLQRMYQVKHPTAVRQEPNFESLALGKFPAGTKVTVIATRGDWVEVRADDGSLAGFIRKEFVTPSN